MEARISEQEFNELNLSFSELLELDNTVTIHQRNLVNLVTKTVKVKNNLSPDIMKQVTLKSRLRHKKRAIAHARLRTRLKH